MIGFTTRCKGKSAAWIVPAGLWFALTGGLLVSCACPAPIVLRDSCVEVAYVGGWVANTAPGTTLTLSEETDSGVELTYDFADTKYSYVVASKAMDLKVPENAAFSFEIRRSKPSNHLEFKIADAVTNMYRHIWYSCGPVDQWERVVVRKSDLSFAWGPDPGRPLQEAGSIEFAITGGKGKGALGIRNFRILDAGAAEGESATTPVAAVPGCYPRWWGHEQAYWTLVGVPDDESEALLCEDGTIEPHKYGFSILPVLRVDERIITRENMTVEQNLEQGVYPIPSVEWTGTNIQLAIQLLATGKAQSSMALARYTVVNNSTNQLVGQLCLLIEPYQVYPPWHNHGGFSPIYSIKREDDTIWVNDKSILLLTDPTRFGACAGGIGHDAVRFMMAGSIPEDSHAKEKNGFASGLIEYAFQLPPGGQQEFHLLIPLHKVHPRHRGHQKPGFVGLLYGVS